MEIFNYIFSESIQGQCEETSRSPQTTTHTVLSFFPERKGKICCYPQRHVQFRDYQCSKQKVQGNSQGREGNDIYCGVLISAESSCFNNILLVMWFERHRQYWYPGFFCCHQSANVLLSVESVGHFKIILAFPDRSGKIILLMSSNYTIVCQ